MKPFKMLGNLLIFCVVLTFFTACSDGNSSDDEKEVLTGEKFAFKAVELFEHTDFTGGYPDGVSDSDGDSEAPDANDEFVILETIKSLGYEVKDTNLNGILENFYTDKGYKYKYYMTDEKKNFIYTEPTKATPADIRASSWEKLSVGDLIFTEVDGDGEWDTVIIYLGNYRQIEHAVLVPASHYDEVDVFDIEDSELLYYLGGNSSIEVRKLKYSSFL